MVTQDILSQGTSNLQIDFKYQSRRNYQYLIISASHLPVYLCIEYQIYLSEVTEFLDFSLILSSILAIVFQNEVLEIKKI